MTLKLLMVPAALIDFSVFCRFEQVVVAVLKVIGDTICISEKLQKQNKLLAVSSLLTLCYIAHCYFRIFQHKRIRTF